MQSLPWQIAGIGHTAWDTVGHPHSVQSAPWYSGYTVGIGHTAWEALGYSQSVQSIPWYNVMGWTVGIGHTAWEALGYSQSVQSILWYNGMGWTVGIGHTAWDAWGCSQTVQSIPWIVRFGIQWDTLGHFQCLWWPVQWDRMDIYTTDKGVQFRIPSVPINGQLLVTLNMLGVCQQMVHLGHSWPDHTPSLCFLPPYYMFPSPAVSQQPAPQHP